VVGDRRVQLAADPQKEIAPQRAVFGAEHRRVAGRLRRPAVICPPGRGAAAVVVAAALPTPLSLWLGAQSTALATTTAKQMG